MEITAKKSSYNMVNMDRFRICSSVFFFFNEKCIQHIFNVVIML